MFSSTNTLSLLSNPVWEEMNTSDFKLNDYTIILPASGKTVFIRTQLCSYIQDISRCRYSVHSITIPVWSPDFDPWPLEIALKILSGVNDIYIGKVSGRVMSSLITMATKVIKVTTVAKAYFTCSHKSEN